MLNNLETNTPVSEDNTEELVLKTEVLEQKPLEEDQTLGANIENICRELEQRIADQYVTSTSVQSIVDKQIKSFFANNVVVRGKTPQKQSELTEHLADIKQRIKDKT